MPKHKTKRKFVGTPGYSYAGLGGTWNELNNNRPSIQFGSLNDPRPGYGRTNHAVLIYGKRTDGKTVIAHYGWAGYQKVYMYAGHSVYAGNTYLKR